MTSWEQRATCHGYSPLFDADIDGETPDEHRHRIAQASEFCRRCPVRNDCAATALTQPVEGVWAGRYHPRLDSQRKHERRRTAA